MDTNQKLIRFVAVAIMVVAGLGVGAQGPAQTPRTAGAAIEDAWITTQIHAKFFADPDIKALNIDVDTSKGIVTLSGTVYSEAERQRVLAQTRDTQGVAQVVDKLMLVPGEPPITAAARDRARSEWAKRKAQGSVALDRAGNEISDAWITTKVQSKFFLDPDVKGLDIDVTTENGTVTLTGMVTSAAERQRAVALAKATDGVKQVADHLTMK